MLTQTLVAAAVAAALLASGAAHAQATVKNDGRWRAAVGLGASAASGNNEAASFSLVADAVRSTPLDKWSLYANALYASSGGTKTSEQVRFGGRYDHDLSARWFGFGGLDFEHNAFANLDWRSQVVGGLGYHAVKADTLSWDLFGGISYTADEYGEPSVIGGQLRSSYAYASLYVGEESTHKLTETTSAKQRVAVYPNLDASGQYRATLDASLAVAMSKTFNLTVGLTVSYNSDPGSGVESTDTVLTTGIAVKFD